jgi:hypothetical protein
MKFFITFITLNFLLTACGSSHPFERGHNSDGGSAPLSAPKEGEVPRPPAPVEQGLDKVFFETNLLQAFERDCKMCHSNPAGTFDDAAKLVVFKKPEESELLLKATGSRHRKVWAADSAEAAVLTSWINGAQ